MNRRIAPGALVFDREVAGVEMLAANLRRQQGILDLATVESLRAPRPKAAAGRPVDHRRRLARDRSQAAGPWPVEPGDRAEQPPGVRVLGVVEDLILVALLDDPARVHDEDPIGDVGDYAQVVSDQDDRRAEVALQVLDQLENLSLN